LRPHRPRAAAERVLAVEEHRAEVGVEDGVPRLFRTCVDRPVAEAAAADAVGADECVEAVEPTEDGHGIVVEVDAVDRVPRGLERTHGCRADPAGRAGNHARRHAHAVMMTLMSEATPVIERIRAERLVAILRRVQRTEDVVAALAAGGIRVVEVTLDSDGALDTIRRLSTSGELTVLAGTVRTPADAEAAVAAGAAACVAPALVLETVERCRELGVPAIPGALTPTELEQALALGAPLVKLFPGRLLGPEYVRDVLAPLAGAPLMVTGGVDLSNAREFIDAGAVAVGVGAALTAAADVEAEARRLVAAVGSV
jgi:2-dehydro-3-deoxyphosphogluconate aldolase / (4S)-4-hydroxy-2-oxoglutarate aldolase